LKVLYKLSNIIGGQVTNITVAATQLHLLLKYHFADFCETWHDFNLMSYLHCINLKEGSILKMGN